MKIEMKLLKEIINNDLVSLVKKINDYKDDMVDENDEDYPVCSMEINGMVDKKLYMEGLLNLISNGKEVN